MNRINSPARTVRRKLRVESLEVRSLLSVAGTAYGGAVNPTFGTQGIVSTPILPSGTTTPSVANFTLSAVEANGTIVEASSYQVGQTAYDTVVEISSTGSLVTSFGDGGQASFAVGTVSTTPGVGDYEEVSAVVVQSDGTIDLAGGFSAATATSNPTFGVLQITPSGTLDTSFGTQGMATLPANAPDKEPFENLAAMTLTSSGQIIVAGAAGYPVNDTPAEFYVARFNVNGTLDTSFGSSGVAEFPIATTYTGDISIDEVASVAVQPNGTIILAGSIQGEPPGQSGSGGLPILTPSDYEGVVIGLNTDGSLDTSFGGTSAAGEVLLPDYSPDPTQSGTLYIVEAGLESDGSIVLLENHGIDNDRGTTLTVLNADGTPDTSFGQSGVATVSTTIDPDALSIEPNGQIIVTGTPGTVILVGSSTVNSVLAERFDADGTVDTSFGGTTTTTPGVASYTIPLPAGSSASGVQAVSLTTATAEPDGQLILTGTINTSVSMSASTTPYFLTIAAYSATPVESQPPADFSGTGVSDIAVYLTASGSFAYRPSNGGADVVAQFGIPGVGQTIPAPGDYSGAGQTELGAYLPSQGIYAYRPANGGPDVLESFGIAGPGQSIPAPGDYFGTGVDDMAVYMPSIGAFGIRNPNGGPDEIVPFGTAGMGQSIPVPGDYFGTGQDDIAVYLPSIGAYAIRNPSGGADEIIPFGIPGAGNSIPIPGDYDGSGKTELAVYLPTLGEFIYRPANGGPDVVVPFGTAGNGSIPDVGDYDGVGYDEIGIYDPNYADFAFRPAGGGPDVIVPFGSPGIGASLPLGAPIASNLAVAPGSVAGSTTAGSSTVSTESVKPVQTTTTVPGGPMAKLSSQTLGRVASTLPAQGDPSKPKV